MLDESTMIAIERKLNNASSREEGYSILKGCCKSKLDLQSLADHLDVSYYKNDSRLKLKNKIVQMTIGSRLNSDAIRNDGKASLRKVVIDWNRCEFLKYRKEDIDRIQKVFADRGYEISELDAYTLWRDESPKLNLWADMSSYSNKSLFKLLFQRVKFETIDSGSLPF